MASGASVLLMLAALAAASAAPPLWRSQRAAPQEGEETEAPAQQTEPLGYFDAPAAQAPDGKPSRPKGRQNKALSYFDYVPQFYGEDDYGEDELDFQSNESADDEDLSRTIPSRRKHNHYKNNNFGNTNSLQYDNSPIFYIRLPPTPYMFVPGLGYVSQPPSIGPPVPPPVNPFINLPIDFVSNGKPTNIYQWTGAPSYQQPAPADPYNQLYQRPAQRPQRPSDYNFQRPHSNKKPSDSKVTTLKKGPYAFNGKPSDSVFVLRDSYNSLYSDALQNFYP